MRRLIMILSILVLLMSAAAPVAAGGWAVTTIVDMPDEFVRGETHEVVFEVRQHGVRLVTDLEDVAVVLLAENGERVTFPAAVRDTQWVATVTTPDAGAWSWSILPGWFAPVELGALPMEPANTRAALSMPRLAAGLVAVLLGGAMLLFVRRPHPAPA